MTALVRVTVQCRAEITGNKLGGYAAVFDQTADLGWLGMERLARGAFDDALPTSDPRALWNHDANYVLGRASSGTLRLTVDDHGLAYEVDLPDTQCARDLRVLVERGDIDGASFGFIPGMSTWDQDSQTRTYTSIKALIDVSPVTFPAYAGASTEARSGCPACAQRAADERHIDNGAGRLRSQLIRARHRARLPLGGVRV